MLAGVAKGLADNFGIVPWIPRVVFLITAFMGGLGIALYAAGWAFIRSEDEAESPAERWFSGAAGTRSWVGIALIVLAGVVVLEGNVPTEEQKRRAEIDAWALYGVRRVVNRLQVTD